MLNIKKYFVDTDPVWLNRVGYEENTKNYLKVRDALNEVAIVDGNTIVPTEWLNQFPNASSFEDVAKHLGLANTWTVYGHLHDWFRLKGRKSKCFVATLSYFATGEGSTYRVIARPAMMLGEFIYGLADDVDMYFLQGMDFYDGIPERNEAFEMLVSHPIREVIERGSGNIRIDLNSHVNYS